jgi:hypothetical protein
MQKKVQHLPAAPGVQPGAGPHDRGRVPYGIGAQRAPEVEIVRPGPAVAQAVPQPRQGPGQRNLREGRNEQGRGCRGVRFRHGRRPIGIRRGQKVVRPGVVKHAQGADRAVQGNAFRRQQGPQRGLAVTPAHAEAGQRRGLEVAPGLQQVVQACPQQGAGQGVRARGRAVVHRVRTEGRGAPVVKMRGDFRAAAIAHPGQVRPGLRVGEYRMGAEQGEGKAQLPGQRRKLAQQGHVAHAAARGGVAARKQAFFLHVQAYNDAQGFGRGGRSGHGGILCARGAQGNGQERLGALVRASLLRKPRRMGGVSFLPRRGRAAKKADKGEFLRPCGPRLQKSRVCIMIVTGIWGIRARAPGRGSPARPCGAPFSRFARGEACPRPCALRF